jgi:DNA invertase Pin-like site-specific DNA recombinase/uncharacterized protein YndB with AHSA1/START domain
MSSLITSTHLARRAYVYIRQSSLAQVQDHQESTALQYLLIQRAQDLGWAPDQVSVIDEDLGQSAVSGQLRPGFQQLAAEVSLGHVGLVLGIEVSRLARSCADWHRLLELCALSHTLLADADGVYDPNAYNDRLLLGLKGTLAEAELHLLRGRLTAAREHKAQRGELALPLPVGFLRQPDGTVTLDPHQGVRERLAYVFTRFPQIGSLGGLLRDLCAHHFFLPLRPLSGPQRGQLLWRQPTEWALQHLLKNPAYAGAYAYGKTAQRPAKDGPHLPSSGTVQLPREQWKVLLHDVYPAYLSWDQYLANQDRLAANQQRFQACGRGLERSGQALLQSLVRCGRCGQRMGVHYSGPQGQYAVYRCDRAHQHQGAPVCQTVRANWVDPEVERLFLAALTPAQIDLAVASLNQLQAQAHLRLRQAELEVQRAQEQADRARRQYQAVEPEHRLVARELERQWNEALAQVTQAEENLTRLQHQPPATLTAAQEAQIRALAHDLPALWQAPHTPYAERKRLLRALLVDVLLLDEKESGRVRLTLHWHTEAVTETEVFRPVASYAERADWPALQEGLQALRQAGYSAQETAEQLNQEGFRDTRGQPFTKNTVNLLFRQHGG